MNSVAASDTSIAVVLLATALGSKPPQSDDVLQKASSEDRASAIIRHRLSRAIVNSGHTFGLDEKNLERVTNDALAHTHAAFQLVGHTTHVSGLLDSENIDFLVIKGIALGALSQTPAGRGAGDVDILVSPRDVPRVHEIFLAHGFRPALALPDMKKSSRWGVWSFLDREATYIGHSTHIDLHWRISSQRHLFPPFADLYARKAEITVADATVPTLSVADSLAAACYHAYFDQFQPLRSVLDVVSLLPRVTPESLAGMFSRPLQKLMAGIITVVREEFPGVVDTEATALLSALPSPPYIVRKRFDDALASPKKVWEVEQDTGALMAKLLAEARFDSTLEVLPRFIGKRLFEFPTWSSAHPSTPLRTALVRRWQVESSRKRSAR